MAKVPEEQEVSALFTGIKGRLGNYQSSVSATIKYWRDGTAKQQEKQKQRQRIKDHT